MLNFVKDLNFEINQKKIIVKVCLQPKIKYIKIKIINHEIVCLINNLTLVDIAQEFIKNNKLKILKLYENDLKRIKYDE
ncbi:M48 family peptidase, partial [Ureaplasma urealyticum]